MMKPRRSFLFTAATLPALLAFAPAMAQPSTVTKRRRVVVQVSQINGLAYYRGERVLHSLRVGDALRLQREPHNYYDKRAVEIFWRDHKLGYLPRVENTAVAQMMDRGEQFETVIDHIEVENFPWRSVRVQITLIA